jgi:uncharacterized membrane protein
LPERARRPGRRAAAQGAQPGASEDPGESARGRRRVHWLSVGCLTAAVAALYCLFALARYYTFATASYDLVIFDQAVRSYAHFHPGISIVKGLNDGFGPNFSVLGDHWSPILAVLAPLYWIHDSPQTLLVAQAVLFALAIPPLWAFTRRAFGGDGKATVAAYLVCLAYALSWPIASALAFDFHEVAFAPVLMAVALERLQAGRLRTALIALGALLLVKEDMGLFVCGVGVYIAIARPPVVRRHLLVGGCLLVAGLADTLIATYVLIPAFGGRSSYYWAYTALGSNVPQALWHLITHPASLRLLVTPQVKLSTMLWLFGAFCFLSLRSPMAVATVPLLLERMLANLNPNWWATRYQYNAYLVVILLCAAVDGAARLDRQLARRRSAAGRGSGTEPAAVTAAGDRAAGDRAAGDTAAGDRAAGDRAAQPGVEPGTRPARRLAAAFLGTGTAALGCAAAMAVVAVVLVPRFSFGPAFHSSFYQRNALRQAAAAADAKVPSGVTVEALDFLGPQLSARDTVLLWAGDGHTPPLAAPWVVANVTQRQTTFSSVSEQVQRVAMLERHGYRVVFADDGYIVLHRPGQAAG